MGNLQNDKQALLTTLAGKEPKLKEGINALLNDKLRFDSLDRAVTNLKNAQNETNLGSVEAALQTAMTRIRELNETNKKDIDDEKASLYLYTLQNLTQCLGSWQFENGNENHYTPQITKKFNTVMAQAGVMGLDMAVMQKKCSAHQYKVADDPYLADFELLDSNKMDILLSNMERTKSGVISSLDKQAIIEDLNSPEKEIKNGEIDHGVVEMHDAQEKDLDRLIEEMTARWGAQRMNLGFINGNLNDFYNMVGISTNHRDLESIRKFASAIVQRLAERQQSKQNDWQANATATQTVSAVK